ncbi:MAG: hypothetical protein FJ291_26805 [Planctomycetes bacterium]|nr:hypothetical protein [Planctomycetota bacterium]
MSSPRGEPRYVLCLRNDGYEASLVVRRLYRRIADPHAARRGLVRVIDESGEDYLFPAKLFAAIALPKRSASGTLAATPDGIGKPESSD